MKIDSTPFNTSSMYLYGEKATIHLNAEVLREGQVRKQKSKAVILLYTALQEDTEGQILLFVTIALIQN